MIDYLQREHAGISAVRKSSLVASIQVNNVYDPAFLPNGGRQNSHPSKPVKRMWLTGCRHPEPGRSIRERHPCSLYASLVFGFTCSDGRLTGLLGGRS